MADMNCLNNEDELESQLDSVSQIDSDLASETELAGDMENVVEVTTNFTGLTTEDIIVSVDNEKKTISAELTDGVKSVIGQNITDIEENKQSIQQLSTDKADKTFVNEQISAVNNTLNSKADKTEIPTKVSQLENDSKYATEEYVNTNGGKIDKILVNNVEQTITNKAVNISVPTKLSELSNDKGLIDNTVNNLVNYYTKSETYTKAEVLDLVAQIPKFSVQIVSTLPTENISTTTIYLLAVTDADENNYYEEYLYANNKWELIGTTKIDLSNYYTKAEVNALIKEYYAGEGLSLSENTFSVTPSSEKSFGAIRLWEEFGTLHIYTMPYIIINNTQEGEILTIRGSVNAVKNISTLTIE